MLCLESVAMDGTAICVDSVMVLVAAAPDRDDAGDVLGCHHLNLLVRNVVPRLLLQPEQEH